MDDPINLNEIRMIEKKKKLFNGFFTYASIQSTSSKASSHFYNVPPDTFEKDFYPSLIRKIAIILLIGFLAFWIIGFELKVNAGPYTRLILLPLIAIMIFIFYDGFLNTNKVYDIHLNFEGISIRDEWISWNEINQTAILQIGEGKGRNLFLILVLNDGTYKKYNLRSFQSLWGFQNAISAYIEYFKKKHLP